MDDYTKPPKNQGHGPRQWYVSSRVFVGSIIVMLSIAIGASSYSTYSIIKEQQAGCVRGNSIRQNNRLQNEVLRNFIGGILADATPQQRAESPLTPRFIQAIKDLDEADKAQEDRKC